jgi:hypothetical protein
MRLMIGFSGMIGRLAVSKELEVFNRYSGAS